MGRGFRSRVWMRPPSAGCRRQRPPRKAQPAPAGLVGTVQPENKTKRQRLSCALDSSLGYRGDSGVVVFPTTCILKFFFPFFSSLAILHCRFPRFAQLATFFVTFWWLTYTKNKWFSAKPHCLGGRHQIWIYSELLKLPTSQKML